MTIKDLYKTAFRLHGSGCGLCGDPADVHYLELGLTVHLDARKPPCRTNPEKAPLPTKKAGAR